MFNWSHCHLNQALHFYYLLVLYKYTVHMKDILVESQKKTALRIISERILKLWDVFFTLGGSIQSICLSSVLNLSVSSSLTLLCSFTWAPLHCTGSLGIVRLLKMNQYDKKSSVPKKMDWGNRLLSLLLIWFQQSRRASLSWRGSKSREQPR